MPMAEMNPSLLLQNHKSQLLHLTTENFIMERGPIFDEYSELRERMLRMKYLTVERQKTPENETGEISVQNSRSALLNPQKKQVKFSSDLTTPHRRRPKVSSVLMQSVLDFSPSLRKENRNPLPPVAEPATPPAGFWKSGSKSAEKRRSGGGLIAVRRSCANMEDWKRLAAAGKEINNTTKAVLGNRLF
ncbi:hypothetical protein OROGR_018099 [Orobanche gracilis]